MIFVKIKEHERCVLGPLLFILYVNDIHSAVPDVNIRLFADDTNLFMHDNNYKSLMQIANDFE